MILQFALTFVKCILAIYLASLQITWELLHVISSLADEQFFTSHKFGSNCSVVDYFLCKSVQPALRSVSEPACFGAAPEIFYPEPAPGKREHNFGIGENRPRIV